jgi:chromosome segregation ATPase|uniref:Uncharacterized protein n=1 Tax=viral metagenome TaxID=1070528 RepID=A0A6C0IKP5_9ZZZZ
MGWFKKKGNKPKKKKQKRKGPPKELISRNIWLKSELRKLKNIFERIKRNIRNMNNEINRRNKNIKEIETQLSSMKRDSADYNNRYKSSLNSIKQYNEEIKTLKKEKAQLEIDIKTLTKQMSILETIIPELDGGNIDLESELDELLIEYNQIKGVSVDNDEQYFELVSVQNNHLHREYDYMKNDLTQGDQESTFVQPTIETWEFTNHFLTIAYYLFAIVLLFFLYQRFSMERIYSTLVIVLLIGLYPLYIVHIEQFLYFYAMYMYNFIRAEPVK